MTLARTPIATSPRSLELVPASWNRDSPRLAVSSKFASAYESRVRSL